MQSREKGSYQKMVSCFFLCPDADCSRINLTKECDCMKRQLQGIALILVSILLMLGYGDVAFFDLSFKWDLIFSVIGITGVIMTFLPDKK